ncbi:hypothetical protein [Dehalobacterium formicoaceticum]|uniref:hypothetical protein n=1 Tax=Dehalobacterium formicoaceticum TaxID=51515 RepID=UPI000B7DF998|nr:hypothetical protein [Dehalobacterium formicoaceticum]
MKLNGYDIPAPITMSIDPFEIAKVNRTASGKYVKDVIAIKNKYSLSYKGLKPESMAVFRSAYEAGEAVDFIYNDDKGEHIVSVYITALTKDIPKYHSDLAQNVNITLEEE